jgi:hypothetical protein
MEAVTSGFHLLESAYKLPVAKLHHLISTLLNSQIRGFEIVEQSLSAFIVPDAQQILLPDESFVSFSATGPIDPETGCPISYLEGPCLAFRSLCKLPTDVRKFQAEYRPELAHLKECIVMSARSQPGDRSPASFLGGGDYDGDTVQLVWQKDLVEAFINADEGFVDAPEDFERENLDKSRVKTFCGNSKVRTARP